MPSPLVMFNTGGASDFVLKIKFVCRFFSIYSSLLHDFYMFHRKKLKYLACVILDNFQTDIIVILKFCSKREGRQPLPHSFRTSIYLLVAVRVPIWLPNLPQTVYRKWFSNYNFQFLLKLGLIRLFKHGSPSIVS